MANLLLLCERHLERHAGSIEEFARTFARTGGQRGSAFAIRNEEKSQAHKHGSTSSSAPTVHTAFLTQLGDGGRTFDLLDCAFRCRSLGAKNGMCTPVAFARRIRIMSALSSGRDSRGPRPRTASYARLTRPISSHHNWITRTCLHSIGKEAGGLAQGRWIELVKCFAILLTESEGVALLEHELGAYQESLVAQVTA